MRTESIFSVLPLLMVGCGTTCSSLPGCQSPMDNIDLPSGSGPVSVDEIIPTVGLTGDRLWLDDALVEGGIPLLAEPLAARLAEAQTEAEARARNAGPLIPPRFANLLGSSIPSAGPHAVNAGLDRSVAWNRVTELVTVLRAAQVGSMRVVVRSEDQSLTTFPFTVASQDPQPEPGDSSLQMQNLDLAVRVQTEAISITASGGVLPDGCSDDGEAPALRASSSTELAQSWSSCIARISEEYPEERTLYLSAHPGTSFGWILDVAMRAAGDQSNARFSEIVIR